LGASEKPGGLRLSHRDQIFAVALVGIIAFTAFFGFLILPRIQSAQQNNPSNQNTQPQSVYTWGYVFIGNKGTPQTVYFDNPTTGQLFGYVGSDKSYSANLLSTYTYSVTINYQSSSNYQMVTCTPIPSTVSPAISSSQSSFRQDFSC